MKKVICLLIILAMVLSVAACATVAEQPAAAEPAAAEPAAAEPAAAEPAAAEGSEGKKFRIGVSYEGPTNDWAASLYYHLDYALNVVYADQMEEVIFSSADGDATAQISQIEDMLTKDLDAIMIQPLSESACVSVIEQATDMGIPVIVYGASALTDKYVSYVDRDNHSVGVNITKWVCEQMGGEGKMITIMGEPGSGFSETVSRAVEEVLADFPNITNLGTGYGEYSGAVTKQVTETYLASNKDITGVVVDGGMMGVGVLEAFIDAGVEPPYMAVDDWNGFQTMAAELGFNKYVSVPGGSENAYVAVETLMTYLNGGEVEKQILGGAELMTGEEVRALIPEGMPDSYWALCKIPEENARGYFK